MVGNSLWCRCILYGLVHFYTPVLYHLYSRGVGASWEDGGRVKKGACIARLGLGACFQKWGATAPPTAPPSITHLYSCIYHTIPEKPWSLSHFHPHSKGLGPSGIFCSLYYCVERLRLERVLDVFQAVQKMQLQRPGMVESVQQYAFIYDCMFEFIRTHSDSQ